MIEQMAEDLRQAADEALMSQDLSLMDDEQKEYYEHRQKEILKRIRERK
jgi:hypothetical protein